MAQPTDSGPRGSVQHALICVCIAALATACGRLDSEVQAGVQAQLAKDPVTSPLKLSVTVRRGVAYLTGETTTGAEQERAIELARSIEGVTAVENNMFVADGVLMERVRKALAADPSLASVPIDVDARNGSVRLMSDQTDRAQRERAMSVARNVDGVRAVEDRMK